jgi:molybdopterin converting factor small subunit
MTDWVDDFVSKLSAEQRQENAARAHALLSDRLITERGPAFFSQLVEEAKTQAEELNAKLGATIGQVAFRSQADSFTITTDGAYCQMTVVVASNLREHRIDVSTIKAGGPHSGAETKTSYPIVVSKLDHLGVEFDGRNAQHTPRGVVSSILRAQFKPDDLIPRQP